MVSKFAPSFCIYKGVWRQFSHEERTAAAFMKWEVLLEDFNFVYLFDVSPNEVLLKGGRFERYKRTFNSPHFVEVTKPFSEAEAIFNWISKETFGPWSLQPKEISFSHWIGNFLFDNKDDMFYFKLTWQ